MTPDDSPRGFASPLALSVACTFSSFLPLYLYAATAPFLDPSIDATPRLVGTQTLVFFGVAFATALVTPSRLAGLDPLRLSVGGIVVVSLLMILFGVFTKGPRDVFLLMAAFGAMNGVLEPTGNAVLASRRDRTKLGLGTGIKLAAVPASTLTAALGGLIASIAETWRPIYVFCGFTLLIFASLAHTRTASEQPQTRSREEPSHALSRTQLPYMEIAFVGGLAANVVLVHFILQSNDLAIPGSLGFAVLLTGSALGGMARVLLGRAVDTGRGSTYRYMRGLFLLGALGLLGLAQGHLLLFVIGGLVTVASMLAWQGLLTLAVMQRFPSRVGPATGASQSAIYLGGAVGPFLVVPLFELAPGTGWLALSLFLLASVRLLPWKSVDTT